MEALLAIILGAGLIFGLMIYPTFSWGFVLMKFWIWFVMPVFPMLHVLTFWQAIGLMFIVSLFHSRQITPKEYDKGEAAVTALIAPWLTLFGGWLIGTVFIF